MKLFFRHVHRKITEKGIILRCHCQLIIRLVVQYWRVQVGIRGFQMWLCECEKDENDTNTKGAAQEPT